jgi:hypothetical protein
MIRHFLVATVFALSLLAHAQAARGTFRITGQVVNSITGEALAGTRLELAPTVGAQWVKAALTLKDGKFTFERLAPGKYQLYAERAGFARQGFDEHPGGFLSAIVVGTGIDSEHLVFRLQPGAAISGTVADEYNEAVRGAQVMLFHRAVRDGKLGTYIAGQAQSDDRGLYKFSPLMAGTYYVVVSARPWYAQNAMRHAMRGNREPAAVSQEAQDQMDALNVAFPLTFFSDATDPGNVSAIPLRTGESFHADFNLRAVTAGHLRIPITKGNLPEVPSVSLTQKIFDDFDMPSQAMMQMASNDSLTLSGFAPGRYLVKVQTRTESDSERSQMMDLFSDATIDLDSITGAASASITGLVHAEGVKLKNTFIQFRNRDTGDVQGDLIGGDGKFNLSLIPAGTYEVSVANSVGVYLANMAASNATANGRTLEIPAGADVRMAIILAKGVGEIVGTALRDDKGISGLSVLLVPDDPQNHMALFRRDQSDSDGTFSLKQVVPGKYTLLAIQDGWDLEWTDPKVLKPFLSKGYALQVEPNGKYDVKVAVQSAAKQ